MKKLMIITMAFFASSAYAYKEGTYSCKNVSDDLPNNTYKIETVQLGSAALPYVEIHRYFKGENSPREVTIRGIASVHSSRVDGETLRVGTLNLDFVNDELLNCKQ